MRKQQLGVSVFSTVVTVVLLGGVLLGLFKLIPVYSEYIEIQNVIKDIAKNQTLSEIDTRKEFEKRSYVAEITSLKPKDLIVVSGGNFLFIRAKYRREVPLVSNVSLAFDFDTSAGKNPVAQ